MAIKAKKLKSGARKLVGAGVQAAKRGARRAAADPRGTAQTAAAALAAIALAARAANRALARRRPRTTIVGDARAVAQSAGKAAAAAAIATVLEMAQRQLERRSRRR
jgi:hypothetical protein